MSTVLSRPSFAEESRPAWEIALIWPNQGRRDVGDYLEATRSTNRLVEFADDRIEVLTMPKQSHQLIVQFLYSLLQQFVGEKQLGRVLFAPFRVRLREGAIREPDIVFMRADHADRMGEDFWDGADLVVEVVSDDPDSHRRDWITKRDDYARAGVPEYWIVDPQQEVIAVFTLPERGQEYTTHGEFRAPAKPPHQRSSPASRWMFRRLSKLATWREEEMRSEQRRA